MDHGHSGKLSDRTDLDKAIEIAEQALAANLSESPVGDRAASFHILSKYYGSRFRRHKKQEDLGKALHASEQAVALSENNLDRATYLNSLSTHYRSKFLEQRNREDIDKAIETVREAIAIIPKDSLTNKTTLNRAICLDTLSSSYATRFNNLKNQDDLEKAIEAGEKAVEISFEDNPALFGYLNNLSNRYSSRFNIRRDWEDLNNAIRLGEQAISIAPRNSRADKTHFDCLSDQAICLTSLSRHYISRFNKLGNPEDAEQSINAAERAVAITPDGSPDLARLIRNLSNRYKSRFNKFGDPEDIENAIRNIHKISTTSPEDGRNLAECLTLKFQRLGKLEDLERATQAAKQALAVVPENGPERANFLNNLLICYRHNPEELGNQAGFDEIVQALEQAVTAIPQNSAKMVAYLATLSNTHYSRFIKSKKMEDLEKAIHVRERAIAIASENSDSRLAVMKSDLSTWYNSKFLHFGNQEDLQIATQLAEQAAAAIAEENPHRARCLNNLASCYHSLFYRLESQKYLNRALECAEKAVNITSEDNPTRMSFLQSLIYLYISRFWRLGNQEDIDRSIEIAEQVVATGPSSKLAGYLTDLSKCYGMRSGGHTQGDIEKVLHSTEQLVTAEFSLTPNTHPQGYSNFGLTRSRSRDLRDAEKAVKIAEQAVEATPEGHPALRRYLQNLSNQYIFLSFMQGDLENFEKILQNIKRTISITPEDTPEQAENLLTLSKHYFYRFYKLKDCDDHENALTCLKKSFAIVNALPHSRIRTGERLYILYLLRQEYNQAASVIVDTVKLLPRVSPRHVSRRDHEWVRSKVNGMSSNACSLVLKTGKPAAQAFELLEIGRCVISSLAIDAQTDVSSLRKYDIQLYKRYEGLRSELSSVPGDEIQFSLEGAGIDFKHRSPYYIERDLQEIEAKIRDIPGFATFQLPLGSEEFQRMARDGPLVAFNITKIRSDALIVTSTAEVKALFLHGLDHSEAVRRISDIGKISSRHPLKLAENNLKLKDFLKWLWLTAVKPVLAELGFLILDPPWDYKLPRIWWITSGILSSAPFHAAGIYEDNNERESTMDFVVSSYISTVKALKFSREKIRKQSTMAHRQALLVCASDQDLDFEDEIEAIQRVIEKETPTVVMKDSTKEDILRQIERSSIIHFSCHGISVGFEPYSQPPKSPSDSYLLLRSSGDDLHADEKLTIDDLAKVRHPSAQLAFLSACSTAKVSSSRLTDEMPHIANSFQLAGYPHVIGTLWEADDESAILVSKTFYKHLSRNNAARALHHAIRKMMQHHWFKDDYLAWVPFVHIGA
ncbi:hypothetical protein TWF694_002510 [Orbilia ellipsospora]|uniref:CHAT domain-containing protein n=1 Tax=Orbilia ellipsospora TaxID=2528407 RepID=A0AAV9X2F1_9PEZI